jgi:aminomethyltransferase
VFACGSGAQRYEDSATLINTDILNLKYYTFIKGTFAGVDNVLISATGYTGAGGV